jgi:hypothetical protein
VTLQEFMRKYHIDSRSSNHATILSGYVAVQQAVDDCDLAYTRGDVTPLIRNRLVQMQLDLIDLGMKALADLETVR